MVNEKKFPEDVIETWPEILSDVIINVVPLHYVYIIEITFKNNKIWEINLKNNKCNNLEKEFSEIVANYEKEIYNIDFKLDIKKIKKDVIKNTKNFLKNKNLL